MASLAAYLKFGPHIWTHPCGNIQLEGTNITISDPKTAPRIILPDRLLETRQVPPNIAAVVEAYSLHDAFYGGNEWRATGEYAFRTARATVERDDNGHHELRAHGPVLEDVVELRRQIRLGRIAPTAPYLRKQVRAGLLGARDALQQLVESLFRAYDHWRLA